jgi:ADP-ribosylglycohydrolase
MRLTPQSIYLSQLPEHEMYVAVRLETMFTHCNEIAIASCYLYTFAISKLINGMNHSSAYELTKKEAATNTDLIK